MNPEGPNDERDQRLQRDPAADQSRLRDDAEEPDPEPRELWALTPWRRVLHWGLIPVLLAVLLLAGVRDIARHGPWSIAWLFVLVPLALIIHQLRAVVAVWLDPADDTLVLFRAAGGALRTQVRKVRRLDHGGLAGAWHYPGYDQRPVRIVTDHAAATLSVLFPDPYDLAAALRDTNPDIHLDL